MIPVCLELHNFLAYRHPAPLNLEGVHIACLAGENGAGKSSLLDAITWALWGRARSNSLDDLIHQGQADMSVALTFDYAGARYRVARQRKGGKKAGQSLLEFQALHDGRWRSLSGAKLAETQQKIVDVLKLDYDTFVNSAYLVQGRADEFTTRTPAERKQVLADILGLSQWEAYEDRAKAKAQLLADEIQRLEGELEGIERELGRRAEYEAELLAAEANAREVAARLEAAERQWADRENIRAELVAAQKEIERLTADLASWKQHLEDAESALDQARLRADAEAFTRELEALHAQLASLEESERQRQTLAEHRQQRREERAALKGENVTLGPQTEPLKNRIEALQAATEPVCPTCGQPLTEDHRHRILAELQAEVESRRERYKQNLARTKEIDSLLAECDRTISRLEADLRQRPALQDRLAALRANMAGAAEAQQQVELLTRQREVWQTRLAADEGRRQQVEHRADDLARTLAGASLTQAKMDQVRLEKTEADMAVGGARQKLNTLVNFERQRTRRKEEHRKLAEQKGLYEELRGAFGKRGVPAMIIETVVPEIEVAANELLHRMTDGRMRVRVDTRKALKTGDLREALDISISDELGTRSYELYSGGEAFRINFAIRIALSRLLARRAGAQLRALFIDEGFGTQDSQGRERLVAAINSIQDDFDRILVITHIDELKQAFPVRIEVTKTAEGSQFAIV